MKVRADWAASAACGIVALDCLQMATGAETQRLFAPDCVWVWWIPAVLWGMAAINRLCK